VPFACSGTCGPCAATAPRTRLRLPGTTRLVLRTSLAGSVSGDPQSLFPEGWKHRDANNAYDQMLL
jgi:hypothetical protein